MSLRARAPLHGLSVPTVDGTVELSRAWVRGPLVVACHDMWCDFCQLSAVQLSCLAPRVAQLGGEILIVYDEDVDQVARTCAERRTQARCASDPLHSLQLALQRDGSELTHGATTCVVDRSGRIAYLHRARFAADIVPIDEVAAAVLRCA